MITIEPTGGLANRMRVIASGIWLKDQLSTGLTVVWNLNDELNCPFGDLFEPLTGVSIIAKPTKYYRLRRSNQPTGFAQSKTKAINALLGIDYCIQEIDFHELIWPGKLDILETAKKNKHLYIQTCQEFGDNLYAFKLFKPISQLLAGIQKTTASFGPDAVGVHIRRTDNTFSIQHSPLDLFTEAMQQAIDVRPETTFYLSSDDAETKATLIEIFGERIITQNKKTDRKSVAGVQDAILDMYCLAATQSILGSYWSSFSDVAARINNIPLRVMKSEA